MHAQIPNEPATALNAVDPPSEERIENESQISNLNKEQALNITRRLLDLPLEFRFIVQQEFIEGIVGTRYSVNITCNNDYHGANPAEPYEFNISFMNEDGKPIRYSFKYDDTDELVRIAIEKAPMFYSVSELRAFGFKNLSPEQIQSLTEPQVIQVIFDREEGIDLTEEHKTLFVRINNLGIVLDRKLRETEEQ